MGVHPRFYKLLKMETDLRAAKAALRREIGAALAGMTPEKRAADSAKICARVRELPWWRQAGSVLLFAPMPAEPDIWLLLAEALQAGKIAALPRFHAATRNYVAARVQQLPGDVVSGHFGIREPAARCAEIRLNHFELVLVPGVAFDRRGNRLGHGRGYYDRLLAQVRGVRWGVAFDEQMAVQVPAGPADMLLDLIVTPTGSVEIGNQ
jgi:5-formyltetrahydrofolate cyclo-ligase